jgi:hypothetical protein
VEIPAVIHRIGGLARDPADDERARRQTCIPTLRKAARTWRHGREPASIRKFLARPFFALDEVLPRAIFNRGQASAGCG